MKPVKLIMTAFGPFQNTEEINFDVLGDYPLFLINGPTGSGKTSILDGICFSLYGKTTGNERDGSQMRCHFSSDQVLTEVVFVFDLAGRRYQIRRSPEQQKPKARGEGYTTKAPEAELITLDAKTGQVDEVLVASKVSEANQCLEALLGLNVDQFRQVMVLPQGKFRELLTADSASRERIFSQLFQTHIYHKIEQSLKEQSADIRSRVSQVRGSILELLSQLEIQDDFSLNLAIEGSKVDEFQKRLAFDQAKQSAVRAQSVLDDAAKLHDLFDQCEDLLRELAEHNLQMTSNEEKRLFLKRLRQVIEIEPEYRERERVKGQLDQIDNLCKVAQSAYNKAKDDRSAVEQRLIQKESLSTMVSDLDKRVFQLQELLPLVKELQALILQRDNLNFNIDKLVSGVTSLNGDLVNFDQQTELLLSQQRELTEQLEELDQSVGFLSSLEKQSDLLGRYNNKSIKINKLRLILDDEKQKGLSVKSELALAERQSKELEWSWHAGQAAELAKQLSKDHPCPVCGSLNHPAPAFSSDQMPTKEQIQHQQQEVKRLASLLAELRSSYGVRKSHIAQEVTEQSDLLSQLNELGYNGSLDESGYSKICAEVIELKEFSVKKEGVKEALLVLSKEVQKRPGLKEDLVSQLHSLNVQHQELVSKLAATDSQIAKGASRLQSADVSENSLEDDLDRLVQKKSELEQSLNALLMDDRRTQDALTDCKAKNDLYAHQMSECGLALESADFAFNQSIKSINIKDIDEYIGILIKKKDQAIMQESIDQFDRASVQLSSDVDSINRLIAGRSRPDLRQVQERCESANKIVQLLEKAWLLSRDHLSHLQRTKSHLVRHTADLERLESDYKVVGTLSDVANGQNAHKVSLQRFVLSVLLDDVLAEASHRLLLMSKGRYQLIRKEDRSKGNKASGLELEVEDAYTGRVRAVETLSGGEGFMAALSLALGLSDVVQAYSGGIRLDVLFIDEGFGSLDAEALDLAVSALIDLRSKGRMIGVISHVAELKEQIDIRVNLTSDRSGSHIQQIKLTG
jgi:exonuclease SbcC